MSDIRTFSQLQQAVEILQTSETGGSSYKSQVVRLVSGADSVLITDHIVRCNGTFTLTMITATATHNVYRIKNSGGGTITVDGFGAETIEGAANFSLAAGNAITLLDATAGNWEII